VNDAQKAIDQIPLFELSGVTTPEYLGDMSIDERWRLFHDANPQVYHAILAVARHAKNHGKHRCGMRAIYEHLRWRDWLETDSESETFKLPNNFCPLYARLVMREHPREFGDECEHGRFFRINARKSGWDRLNDVS